MDGIKLCAFARPECADKSSAQQASQGRRATPRSGCRPQKQQRIHGRAAAATKGTYFASAPSSHPRRPTRGSGASTSRRTGVSVADGREKAFYKFCAAAGAQTRSPRARSRTTEFDHGRELGWFERRTSNHHSEPRDGPHPVTSRGRRRNQATDYRLLCSAGRAGQSNGYDHRLPDRSVAAALEQLVRLRVNNSSGACRETTLRTTSASVDSTQVKVPLPRGPRERRREAT